MTAHRHVTDLLLYKAKKVIYRWRKQIYESANKCGKLLARTLREKQPGTYVPLIIGADGEKFTLPRQIAQKFCDFYSTLYNLHLDEPEQSVMDDYLATSGMTGLTTIAQQELDSPITLEEIQAVVNLAKVAKAPGPGGLTDYYYKILFPILGPYLEKMFNGLGDSDFLSYRNTESSYHVIA